MARKAAAVKIEIPAPLIEAVKVRRAIPFLGGGASKEAKNLAGKTPPDADQLRDLIAMRFFNREIKIAMSWPSPRWQLKLAEVSPTSLRLCVRRSKTLSPARRIVCSANSIGG